MALSGADEFLVEVLADEASRPWLVLALVLALGVFLSWRLLRSGKGVPWPVRLALYAAVLLVGGFFAAGGPVRWADYRARKPIQQEFQRRVESEEAARKKSLAEQVHAIRTSERLPARARLLRLTATGAVDPSFSATGFWGSSSIRGLLVQPDGRVLVVGYFNYLLDGPDPKVAHAVMRLLPDGRPDEPFTVLASRPSGYANWVALGAEGRILLGLDAAQTPVIRLEPTGALDGSFALPAIPRPPPMWPVVHGSGEALERLYAVDFLAQFDQVPVRATLQPDGKLLVQGRFTSVGPNATPSGAVRFEGGRFDATFVPEPGQSDFVPVPLAGGSLIARRYRPLGTVVLGLDGRADEARSETLAHALSECVGSLELAEADDRGGFFGAGKAGSNGTLAHFTPDLTCDRSFAPVLRGTAVTALAPLPGGGVLVATFP